MDTVWSSTVPTIKKHVENLVFGAVFSPRRVSAAHLGWVSIQQASGPPPRRTRAAAARRPLCRRQANRRNRKKRKRKPLGQELESHQQSRRSQSHRCFPRPQRPAASCDSRTGRLARPASDWHVPRRWSHQPGDTEAECPAGALSICCRRRRLRGPSRRRREIRPNLSTQKLRPGESRHQVLPGEPIILD